MGAEKILPLFWSQRSDFGVLRKFEVFSTTPPVESLRECSGENPESLSIMGAEKTLPVSWSRRSDFGVAIYHGGRENPAPLLESEVGLWSFTKVEVFSTEPPVESLRECSGENPESLSIMGAEKTLPLFWSQRSDFGVAIYHGGRENLARLLESEVGLWRFTKVEVFSTEPPVELLRECSGENPESLSIMGAEKILPLFWSQRSDFGVLRKFEVFSTTPPVESLRECSGENPESLSIMGAEKTLPLF
ncbi:unnamed protein product [Orchesella dallaii]|uniref:Uncharacterized protein n=1 Tax=Orchesella dallaii TaxID=48710 RepID=A0ABP1PI54_9HEXA